AGVDLSHEHRARDHRVAREQAAGAVMITEADSLVAVVEAPYDYPGRLPRRQGECWGCASAASRQATRQRTREGMTQQKVSGAQRATAPWVKSTLMKSTSGQSVAGAGYRPSLFVRAYDTLAEKVDRRFGWDRLPVPLGLAVLGGLRNKLRRENLYDTSALP